MCNFVCIFKVASLYFFNACLVSPISPGSEPNFIAQRPHILSASNTVIPAPNNISCNAASVANGELNLSNGHLMAESNVEGGSTGVASTRPPQRDRRQRSIDERRVDSAGRRRSGRNRSSMAASHGSATQNQAQQLTPVSKLDLPPGYG